MIKYLLVLSFTLAVACAKNPSPNKGFDPSVAGLNAGIAPSDGGQDSGGGDHIGSSYTEIKKIIENKSQLLDELGFILLNLYNINQFAELEEYKDFVNGWNRAVAKSRWNLEHFVQKIKPQEICQNEDNEITSGATIKLKSEYEVCINLKKLSFVPIDSLKTQIHALLIHEFTHVIGLDEKDQKRVHENGEKIQKIVIENYNFLNGKKHPTSQLLLVFQKSSDVLLSQLNELSNLKPIQDFTNEKLSQDPVFHKKLKNITTASAPIVEQSLAGLSAELSEYHSKHPDEEIEIMVDILIGTRLFIAKLYTISNFLDPDFMKTRYARENKAAYFKTYIDPKGPNNNLYRLHKELNYIIKNLEKSKSLNFSKAKLFFPNGNYLAYE